MLSLPTKGTAGGSSMSCHGHLPKPQRVLGVFLYLKSVFHQCLVFLYAKLPLIEFLCNFCLLIVCRVTQADAQVRRSHRSTGDRPPKGCPSAKGTRWEWAEERRVTRGMFCTTQGLKIFIHYTQFNNIIKHSLRKNFFNYLIIFLILIGG